jgi:DUF4097 and DUF4098 domain-containing protein YvlB
MNVQIKTKGSRKQTMKTFILSGVLVSLCIIGGCCIGCDGWGGANEKYERTEDLSRTAATFTDFQTETINGSITIRGEQTDQIRVQAVITGRAATSQEARRIAEETSLQWQEAGSVLTLSIRKPELPKPDSVSVSLDIALPKQMALNLKSTNGAILAVGIERDVIARTTNGRIELQQIGGRAEVSSTNGSILAGLVAGDLACTTTNGKIACTGLVGNLNASTTNGSVEAGYEPSAPADRSIRIHSTNGSVTVTLPSSFAGQAEASTSNGKLICDRPVTVSGRIDKHLSGTIGQGSGRLVLKTTNGSIHIR